VSLLFFINRLDAGDATGDRALHSPGVPPDESACRAPAGELTSRSDRPAQADQKRRRLSGEEPAGALALG
jgi:hypothetical protein